NDVTVGDKKVAGILIDASIESGKIDYLVLGIGINFKINPVEIEKMIKHTANYYGVTTLLKKNESMNPIKLVQRFLLELEKLYQLSLKKDLKYIMQEWTKRSSTIGKSISIKLPDEKLSGKALRIDDDGALVISNKDKTRRVIVGDIS
ncbi:MAG TPA: biotin--[acetyl-CoA-carboxylase] ligase, partial [Nitrosopumilaceae archaeon]|nr:biotin--[acetyl-CoA-carboxylase] ligase [Nitrosopumilaceae archaeon]